MIQLERIDTKSGQERYYCLSLCRSLFGEWILVREWGRLDSRGGGRRHSTFFDSEHEAEAAMQRLKRDKLRRGYQQT